MRSLTTATSPLTSSLTFASTAEGLGRVPHIAIAAMSTSTSSASFSTPWSSGPSSLTPLLTLTPAQLLTNFPTILSAIQRQSLLAPPPSSASASHSLYLRFVQKATGLIEQGQRAAVAAERWCGLRLLLVAIAQADSASLQQHSTHWMRALSGLHKQSPPLPSSPPSRLHLLTLQCEVALLCRVSDDAGTEVRRELVSGHLSRTFTLVLEAVEASSTSSSSGPRSPLRRSLRLLQRLLSRYAASLRSGALRTQSVLSSLLLHPDEAIMPLVTGSLSLLLLSLSSSSSSASSRHRQLVRVQRDSHETEEEQQERSKQGEQAADEQDDARSPYWRWCERVTAEMAKQVAEVRAALGEEAQQAAAAPAGAEYGLGWEELKGDGVQRAVELELRHSRLCAAMSAMLRPAASASITSAVDIQVPVVPVLRLLFACLSTDVSAASSSSSFTSPLSPSSALLILPLMFASSLRLLLVMMRELQASLLPHARMLAALLLDLHRRCSSSPLLRSLLPLLYELMAAFFLLPLSPSLLSSLVQQMLPALLSHVQQPFLLFAPPAAANLLQQAAAAPSNRQSQRGKPQLSAVAGASSSSLAQADHAVAVGALQCLQAVLQSASLLPVALRARIDGSLLVAGVAMMTGKAQVPTAVRAGVLRCLLQSLNELQAGERMERSSPLLVYALELFVWGAREGEEEQVRAVCSEAVSMCEWQRVEREGVSGGKRRRADTLLDSRDQPAVQEQPHLLDGLDGLYAQQQHAASPPAAASSSAAASPFSALAAGSSAEQVGAKRRRAEEGQLSQHQLEEKQDISDEDSRAEAEIRAQQEQKVELETGMATADDDEKEEEEEDDDEDENEAEMTAAEEAGLEKEEKQPAATGLVPGQQAEIDQEEDDDDDDDDDDDLDAVPLNVDADPDDM